MSKVRLLSRSDVIAALPMDEAIAGMKEAYAALSLDKVDMPLRARVAGQDEGISLVMPSFVENTGAMGVKIVSVFPQNIAQGLPTIHAMVLVIDSATGQIFAMMEGGSLTAIRTGAGAGAATDLLARSNAQSVAIIGSGVQARTQLEAVCTVREIRQVWVYSPTAVHAQTFAQDMAGQGRIPDTITVANSANDAIANADIICAATTASTPVFDGKLIEAGTHINGVGSFTPTMQEFDELTLQKSRIYMDSKSAVLEEAGEIIIALNNGAITESDLYAELGEVVNGTKAGRRSSEEITFFKSVGVAVQDAVAANIALRYAEKHNIGTFFEMDT